MLVLFSILLGGKGILRYRGYPIEQLAEKSTFLEVAYLLIYGQLPDRVSRATSWTGGHTGAQQHSRYPSTCEQRGHVDASHDASCWDSFVLMCYVHVSPALCRSN